MKITCDIVRDLMPLYVDDVCSDDSRKLIEDHINHCSKCQNELAAMKDPIECPTLSEVGDSKTCLLYTSFLVIFTIVIPWVKKCIK